MPFAMAQRFKKRLVSRSLLPRRTGKELPIAYARGNKFAVAALNVTRLTPASHRFSVDKGAWATRRQHAVLTSRSNTGCLRLRQRDISLLLLRSQHCAVDIARGGRILT